MYAIAIKYTLENNSEKTIYLESIEDVRIQASSSMTEHPIPTGYIVADHMFKNPDTVTVSGSVSAQDVSKILQSELFNPTLADFENFFTKLKDSGSFCTIYKLNRQSNDVQFSKKESLVLQSCQWVERINSLNFTFTFREVMIVDITEYIVNTDERYMVDITEPPQSSFTSSLIDWTYVDAYVVEKMVESERLDVRLLNFAQSLIDISWEGAKGALAGVAVGGVIAGLTVKTLATLAPLAAVSMTGKVIIAGVAITVATWAMIKSVKKWFKKKKAKEAVFKYYETDEENRKEVERFADFIGNIHQQLMLLNESLFVYEIVSDNAQETLVTINGEYYIFKIYKNNVSEKWSCKITNVEDDLIADIPDISTSPTSYVECTIENNLFRAAVGGQYVYLLHSGDDDKLTSYCILVSDIDPSEINSKIEKIIDNAINV